MALPHRPRNPIRRHRPYPTATPAPSSGKTRRKPQKSHATTMLMRSTRAYRGECESPLPRFLHGRPMPPPRAARRPRALTCVHPQDLTPQSGPSHLPPVRGARTTPHATSPSRYPSPTRRRFPTYNAHHRPGTSQTPPRPIPDLDATTPAPPPYLYRGTTCRRRPHNSSPPRHGKEQHRLREAVLTRTTVEYIIIT